MTRIKPLGGAILNQGAANNKYVQDYVKSQVEKIQKKVDKIQFEVDQLLNNDK